MRQTDAFTCILEIIVFSFLKLDTKTNLNSFQNPRVFWLIFDFNYLSLDIHKC